MRELYYAHVLYYDPAIYDYDYINDMNEIDGFVRYVFEIMKNHYNEIEYTEEANRLDHIGGWDDFIEENNIAYNEDEEHIYEPIWRFIKMKIESILKDNESKDVKFDILVEVTGIFLRIIEDVKFNDRDFLFQINIFKDSKSFSKHFFSYLEDISDTKYGMKMNIFKQRIESINNLIKMYDFPNNDFHEGILSEWINIFDIIYGE
jgi:hypothetical protein